jgi:replicative DNA helicase
VADSVSQGAGASPDLKHSRREKAGFSSDPSSLLRLPPHSPEAEQGVLGCVLLSPAESLAEAMDKLRGAEAFYDLRHQTIYIAMVEMADALRPIDVISLQQHLKDRQQLEQIGGVAYLASLPDLVPSAANLNYYVEIVAEKHDLREMISICTAAVGDVYQHEGAHRELIEDVERRLLQLVISTKSRQHLTIKEAVNQAIDTIEALHQNRGLSGLATGFHDLDRLTNGLHNSEMIVLAGRPSTGKTSLAMNIVEHVAIDLGLPVGVFSLEMSIDSLVMRMICSRGRLDSQRVREGWLVDGDFPKITTASGRIAKSPIYIDDTPSLSVMQLRSKARRMHQLHGIKLFVIDYLQLMRGSGRRYDGRQAEMTDVSNGVKALAKELAVPVIALSQLNRELDKDKDRKPRLSDLRETGAIEQDADVVGILYRPDADNETAVNLLVPKQRNGPTGDVPLVFLKASTRFESAAPEPL